MSLCTGPFALAFTVTAGALPWHINAASFNSATGTTTGTLTGVHASLSGPGCTAVVDGTGATAHNSKVTITYTNTTHTLKVLTTGGNLHIYNVSGCAGAVYSGDSATQSAAYAISPRRPSPAPNHPYQPAGRPIPVPSGDCAITRVLGKPH